MTDFSEREEQEMIELAKAGDPEANYRMSLWALDQAIADPEDERWNRLAAKCLVKSAEAGYVPAQERMAQLLAELNESQPEPEPAPEPAAVSAFEEDDSFDWSADAPPVSRPRTERPAPNTGVKAAALGGIAAAKAGQFAKATVSKGKDLFARITAKKTPPDEPEPDAAAVSSVSGARHVSGKTPFFRFSQWDDGKWKKMQRICLVICVVLALLITVLIFSGRKNKSAKEEASQIPAAATAEPITATPTPSPVPYPDEAVRDEIENASLDIYPEDSDYVSEATSAKVSAGSGLNLRKGPASSYNQVVLMKYNSEVEVYAYKNSWALVRYNGDTWGWCSTEYLK